MSTGLPSGTLEGLSVMLGVAIGGAAGSSLLHPDANAQSARSTAVATGHRLRDETHFMEGG
jgi:hypothetical protein